jgi:hypothetical protein
MQRLHPGDSFPTLTVAQVGGGSVTLPVDISTPYSVILTYRAHW